MKIKVLLFFLFIIIIGAIVFIFDYQKGNNFKAVDKRNSFKGNCIYSGYISDIKTGDKIIISSYSDLVKYCLKYNENGHLDSLLEKYKKDFFKTESLAIVYISLNSGSLKTELIRSTRNGNNVIIEYSIPRLSGDGTCDMSGELIVVEIDKDINNIIDYKI